MASDLLLFPKVIADSNVGRQDSLDGDPISHVETSPLCVIGPSYGLQRPMFSEAIALTKGLLEDSGPLLLRVHQVLSDTCSRDWCWNAREQSNLR